MNTKAPSGVRLEVRGEWYAPSDLAWLEWAPCGCLCGVMTVRDRLTPEAAWDDMHELESAAFQKLQKEQGFRIELDTFEHYRTLTMAECPHSPLWGVPGKPTPEGWEWRIKDGRFAGKNAVQHLFPPKSEGQNYYRDPLVSLCTRARDSRQYKPEVNGSNMPCRECAKRGELIAIPSDV